MSNCSFLFVGGLHRSGTTLLHDCLAESKSISSFSNTYSPENEGQHLQSVYLPAKAYGGPGEFAYNLAAYMDESNALVCERSRDKLFTEWGMYLDYSKPIMLEKSPPNIIRSRFLRALFPSSKFIFMLRNPVVVAMATKKWSSSSYEDLIDHSLLCIETMLSDVKLFDEDDFRVIKYEDFTGDPGQNLNQICDWLDCAIPKRSLDIRISVNEKYFKSWKEKHFLQVQRRAGDAWVGETLLRFERIGYSLF